MEADLFQVLPGYVRYLVPKGKLHSVGIQIWIDLQRKAKSDKKPCCGLPRYAVSILFASYRSVRRIHEALADTMMQSVSYSVAPISPTTKVGIGRQPHKKDPGVELMLSKCPAKVAWRRLYHCSGP